MFVVKREPKIEVRWKAEGLAVIACNAPKEDVFNRAVAFDGIEIEYENKISFEMLDLERDNPSLPKSHESRGN